MPKPKEDNRDVFDKALDYAPAAVGALAGNLLLRRQSKKAQKAYKDYEASAAGRRMRRDTSVDGSSPDPLYAGNRNLRNAAADASFYRTVGTIAGGGAGALAGDMAKGQSKKKRRK